MTRDRLVSVFVVLTVATVGVVAWLVTRPTHTEHTTVLVEPSLTPLRDSIREPKATKKRRSGASARSRKPLGAVANPGLRRDSRPAAQSPTRTGARTSPSPSRKRQSPARKPAPAPSSPAPQQPPQKPLVDVTVPAPASACVKGVGGLNC